MDLDYFWTDMAFEICSPVNMVIQLFHPRDDMGHVECDKGDNGFPP